MTNREVIEILGELKKCYLGGIVDAIDIAIEAVKAQEPVKPRASRGWYKCGACGNGIATILDNGEPSHKERYCNLCGRAVKWE